MARLDISLIGDAELATKLGGLTDKLERKVVRQAIRKAAQLILRDAKQRAPVESGALRRNIRIKALRRSRRRVGFNVQTGTREQMGISPDDPFYYPALVELGVPGRIEGRRFMRDALRDNRDQALKIMRDEILKGVEREVPGP